MSEAPTLAPPASVHRAVGSLDAADRAVLALVHQRGFTAAEVAEHLGVPRSEVHRRLRASLLAIKAALAPEPAPA